MKRAQTLKYFFILAPIPVIAQAKAAESSVQVQSPQNEIVVHPDDDKASKLASSATGLACPVAAVVVDIFCTALFDAAHELAVPAYVYMISSAAMCALMLRSPALDEEAGDSVEFEEAAEGGVDVPGLPPVPASCLPMGLENRKISTYQWFLYNGRRYMEASGIIVNTVAELEPSVLEAIAAGRCTRWTRAPPVYTIGPVLPLIPAAVQPAAPAARVRAVARLAAAGICGAPLLRGRWVFHGAAGARGGARPGARRAPLPVGAGRAAGARHEGAHGRRPRRVAPGGFHGEDEGERARVAQEGAAEGDTGARRRGRVRDALRVELDPREPVVRRAEAPWPCAAEQHLNAFTLVAAMGVAVAMGVDTKRNNFVEAAELERAVKALMDGSEEGRKAREKAVEMKGACRTAVEEEGGSSFVSLQRLAQALVEGAVPPK
ncbi:hypothetical protein ACP4OV_029541 [Aristida adscensionis]